MTVVDGVRLISNSEVQTFKDCPRKWWLAWFRGLRAAQESPYSAAAIGGRYHESLAGYYVGPGETPVDPLLTLAWLQEAASMVFNQSRDPFDGTDEYSTVRIDQEDKLLKAFELERAMIEGYVQWLEETGVDSALEVIGSEVYVEVDSKIIENGQPVKLIGKLDARVRSLINGQIAFIDHKTVGTFLDPTLHLNQQMLHYHLIVRRLALRDGRELPGAALYNMARKVKRTRASKPPYFERRTIHHNDIEIRNYEVQLYGTIERIIHADQQLQLGERHHRVVPARPSRDCSWKCSFLKICHMFDDGSRVEAAIEDLYQIGNPLDYYGGREKGSDDVA